jgi:hypothetical protein
MKSKEQTTNHKPKQNNTKFIEINQNQIKTIECAIKIKNYE